MPYRASFALVLCACVPLFTPKILEYYHFLSPENFMPQKQEQWPPENLVQCNVSEWSICPLSSPTASPSSAGSLSSKCSALWRILVMRTYIRPRQFNWSLPDRFSSVNL